MDFTDESPRLRRGLDHMESLRGHQFEMMFVDMMMPITTTGHDVVCGARPIPT